MGLKLQGIENDVYVMIGDGELQEGEVWEGAMFAAHHELKNLCTIIDYNKLQSDDFNKNIMGLEPLVDKWRSFGWNALEIDGHNDQEISQAFARHKESQIPTVIIANTVKGKGVSYMENIPSWHGSLKLSDEDLTIAFQELGGSKEEIEAAVNG